MNPTVAINKKSPSHRTPIRIYLDGCFDMIHSGHYNALRQAKATGEILVVGLISDSQVSQYKGPPILTWDERAEIIRSCKWVDEVCV